MLGLSFRLNGFPCWHPRGVGLPVVEALTQARGALTLAGAGAVNVGQLSPTAPFTATSSTYTLTSGTAGHWTLPVDGSTPTPTAAGVTAGLNGGPYVFNFIADNSPRHHSGTLTITTRANTYTASLGSELASILTATAGIDGKSVELARGSSGFKTADFASRLFLTKWRAATLCTFKNEDDAHPTPFGNVEIKLPNNLYFKNIAFQPGARVEPDPVNSPAVDKAVYVRTTAPSTGTDQETTNSVTFDGCSIAGVADPTKTVYGFYCTDDGAPLTVNFIGNTNVTWTQKPVSFGSSTGHGLTVNGNIAGSEAWLRIRYWTEDGFIPTSDAAQTTSWNFHRVSFMSPMEDPTHADIHPDSFQFPAGINAKNFNVDIADLFQGNGNSISQTFFSKNSFIGATIGNLLSCGRSKHCFTISGTDATHVVTGSNITAVTQWSGPYGPSDIPGTVLDPGLWLVNGTATVDPAYLNLSHFWAQGTINNGSSYAPTADVVNAGLTGGDISSVFPNAGRISSAALKTAALANNVANSTAVLDPIWDADFDTVVAFVEAALTPASGQVGALKSDGTRPIGPQVAAAATPSIVEGTPVTNSSATSTAVSTAFTPGAGSNRRILAFVEWNGSGGSALACSVVGDTTVAMTQVDIQGSAATLSASNEGMAMFELAEASWPANVASLSATVTHTGTPSSMGIEAMTLKDAPIAAAGAQSVGGTNLATPLSMIVTPSADNSLVVGSFGLSISSSTADWGGGLTKFGPATNFRYPATPAKTAVAGQAVQAASGLTITSPTISARGMMIAAYFAP